MTHVHGVGANQATGYVSQGQAPKTLSVEELAALLGTDPASLAGLVESGAQVTPEWVMGLLESRVNNIDAQIGDLMSTIDARTARAKELQEQQAAVQDLQIALENLPETDGKVVVDDIEINGVKVNLEDYIKKHGLSDQVTLIKEGGQTKISKDALQTLSDKLGEQQRTANSGNELDMIRLQSAMQQRSQAITLASNMIKSIFDTLKAIVSNLR